MCDCEQNDFIDVMHALLTPVAGNKTLEAGDMLYERFGSLSAVLAADIYELEAMLGEKIASHIKLLAYVTSRRLAEHFAIGENHSDDEISEYLKALFLGLSVENMYLLSFGETGEFLGADRLSMGSVNAAAVVPRSVVETAIIRGAKRVLLAHNHPGGNPTPSKEDTDLTSALARIFENAGIELLGHIVVAGNESCLIPV